jgi:hypothetical protein
MSALEEMNETLKEICKSQRDTKNALWAASDHIIKEENSALTVMCDRGFSDKYSIELPIKEFTDFLIFDAKLKSEESVRRDFVSTLLEAEREI